MKYFRAKKFMKFYITSYNWRLTVPIGCVCSSVSRMSVCVGVISSNNERGADGHGPVGRPD